MKELRADAVVEPHAARDVLHIGTDLLAQIGDFVDERDLRREEGIRGVFDQLCRTPADIEDGSGVQVKRPLNLREHSTRTRIVSADDNAIGMLEILYRGALTQKLGVGSHRQFGVRAHFAQDALDLIAGANRHSRFGDDDGRSGNARGNLAHRLVDETQIGISIAPARRRQ